MEDAHVRYRLVCDCGCIVQASNECEFLAIAGGHAHEVHGIDLADDTILRLAVDSMRGQDTGWVSGQRDPGQM